MASSFLSKLHFSLFTLLSLLILSQARFNLDPSDLKAISIIQRDLGLTAGQHHPNTVNPASTAPCNTPGIYCERRLSENKTHVLRITRLVFKYRGLTGFLSPEIRGLTKLKELSLSNNNLVGQIPSQIVECRKLEILDLGKNQFSGVIPSELSSLVRLRVLDFSSNKFSGDLNFLQYLSNLEHLSLADNLFTGKIPKSVSSFRNLQSFNVSGNSLLETSVPLMSKVEFSKANSLPKRHIFAERSNSIAVAPSAGEASTAPAPAPAAAQHNTNQREKKIKGWTVGFLVGTVAGTISGFVFSVLCKIVLNAIRGGRKDSGPSIFSPLIKNAEDLAFLEKDDGLASMELIGRGGCGEVYKAELPGSNGKMIAIKRIAQPTRDAVIELNDEESRLLDKKMRQIKSEIQTVGQIRHRNLLPLVAHVPRPDCHYLVYEYMKNGSLQDVMTQVSLGTRELDWLARHKIALGVAAGLEYLHISHSPRVIHRDLKPANLLLDDDMEARIADFGLARAMPDANTHMTMSNVAGTLGYIAPEYHQTVKFTDKCDIYSFGVVLGVLVLGKLPSDDFFQHTAEISLVKWMTNMLVSEKPSQAIDPKLRRNGFEEQMLLVLKIACFCTLEDPRARPNSKDVRCMLSQIKH